MATARDLDLAMFDQQDLLNIVLQRSEVLSDVPAYGKLIRAWEAGDPDPLNEVVTQLGPQIATRAATLLKQEFDALLPRLEPLNIKHMADIGCGYGFFDLFAHRALGCDLLLIDIEESDHRHFGYRDEGSAYSNLARARDFLTANGVPDGQIVTWNPDREDLPDIPQVDLAVSLLSCGYHYPVEMYLPFFRFAVRKGGYVLLDLRAGKILESNKILNRFGTIEVLDPDRMPRRVLVRKGKKRRKK